jgi:hypothetical protein
MVSGVGNFVGTTIYKVGEGVSAVVSGGSSENDTNTNERSNINFSNISKEAKYLLSQTGQLAFQPENLEK